MYAAIIDGEWDFGVTAEQINEAFAEGRCRAVCRYPEDGCNNEPALAIVADADDDWDTRGETYMMSEASWTLPVKSAFEARRLARVRL